MPRTRAPQCWRCYRSMRRLYYRVWARGKIMWRPAGWICPHCRTYRDLSENMLITPSQARKESFFVYKA